MHVLILHNAVAPDASEADRDVLVQAAAVAKALDQLGHRWTQTDCSLDLESARRRVVESRSDVVFNLVESLAGSDWMSFAALAMLDTLGVPYTGNPTEAMLLSTHKLLAKQRLAQAGLPTPPWVESGNLVRLESVDGGGRAVRLPTPYIVKAVGEHASFGLDEHSVIATGDGSDVAQRLAEFNARLGCPCFAESFVEGREFNLSVLGGPGGPQVLPPAEIDFSAFPAGKPRVVGYRAKWADGTFEFHHTPRRFDFPARDRPLLDRLSAVARDCWTLFGLKGWVRVDFRVDADAKPWVLEINANPCLSPDAGFAAALTQAGISFAEAVERMLQEAIRGK